MGALLHLLFTVNSKETKKFILQKRNWDQYRHSYRFMLNKNILLIYIHFKNGLDELINDGVNAK